MDALHELTIAEIGTRMEKGSLSPVALAEAYLARIKRLEPTLKVWATLDTDFVLRQARRVEAELKVRGPRGPLHGVPVGIKDVFYTKDLKTTGSSKVHPDFIPSYDATVITRLKRAGAIIMGKTHTAEFATSGLPPTMYPWNLAHNPGGSSTGSGAALGAKMVPAALGTQTGGSNLRPASYNGVVGYKATYGRIPRYGVITVSFTMDHVGIIVRTVEDSALVLQVLSGYDTKDPGSSRKPVPDFRKALNGLGRPPRIGLLGEFFHDTSDEETRAHTKAVVGKLTKQGAVVENVKLPKSFAQGQAAGNIVMSSEFAAYHEALYRERGELYGPALRTNIESSMLIPAVSYIQAHRWRRRFWDDMVQTIKGVDVLLCATTPAAAPEGRVGTGDASFLSPWTTIGFPSISIPSGLSAKGLPLGTQLIAAPFADADLLGVARWCERVLNVKLSPPDL